MGSCCCNKQNSYIECAQEPNEKSIRIFEKEIDLSTVTFYEILSDFNCTFLYFNEHIPEKIFDEYIQKNFKNENVKKLFEFKEIRQKGLIKMDMVRYTFLLLCCISIKNLVNEQKTYDKSEFILNTLFNEDGGTSIDKKFVSLLHLACNIVPALYTISKPSLTEEEKKYIHQVQIVDNEAISYVLKQIEINEDLTIEILNKKFEENPNVRIIKNNTINTF